MTSAIKIEDVELFSYLTAEDFVQLKKCLHEKKFKKGDLLFREGQCCERVFIVAAGRVKIYKLAENGREQIFEILEAGQSCICNPGRNKWDCTATGEALTDCSAWFLNRSDFSGLINSNGRLSKGLLDLFSGKIQTLRNLVGEVSLQDVKKRLIRFLLDLHAENAGKADSSVLEIPFTREEMGQRLGTTRETVTRYLMQLKEEGDIEVLPSQIRVISASRLENKLHSA